ncbi:MAG: hypothetical protein KatS3mg011_2194 [Acidimicrobiia bacterium]|nr:MAG: hypothetical protein KatS3mg011_2194 [Acidimicrobiia bacterium]
MAPEEWTTISTSGDLISASSDPSASQSSIITGGPSFLRARSSIADAATSRSSDAVTPWPTAPAQAVATSPGGREPAKDLIRASRRSNRSWGVGSTGRRRRPSTRWSARNRDGTVRVHPGRAATHDAYSSRRDGSTLHTVTRSSGMARAGGSGSTSIPRAGKTLSKNATVPDPATPSTIRQDGLAGSRSGRRRSGPSGSQPERARFEAGLVESLRLHPDGLRQQTGR